MRKSLLLAGLLGMGVSLPVTVMAEDAPAAAPAAAAPAAEAAAPAPDWTFPASISFVSDYIFRGQSQSWGKPAAQFGIEADHKSGFYAGFAASNVSDSWLAGADLETDFYGGLRGNLPGAASAIGFDIGGIYYYYPGANWSASSFTGSNKNNELNTFEVYASLSYKFLSLKAGSTLTDYWGWNKNNSGPVGVDDNTAGIGDFNGNKNAGVKGNTNGSYFYEANASYEVFPSWTLSGQLGRQIISDSHGLDITYYKAGVTKAFSLAGSSGWSVGAFYSGSSEPDAYKNFQSLRDGLQHPGHQSDVARDTGFVTITKSF
jgi:uncharacterized protein (TIGR02001 family)